MDAEARARALADLPHAALTEDAKRPVPPRAAPPRYSDLFEAAQARGEDEPPPRRRRTPLIVAGLLVVAALVVAGWVAAQRVADSADAGSAAVETPLSTQTTKTATTGPRRGTTSSTATEARAPNTTQRQTPPPSRPATHPTMIPTQAASPGKPRTRRPAQPKPTQLPDFVWVSVPKARGYEVEFRSGKRVVLRARTEAPRLHVTAAQLPRGTYRWLVWPLTARGQLGRVLVDAKTTIR